MNELVNSTNALNDTLYENANVYQANALIEACRRMSLLEGRLFYLGLMALRPQLSEPDKLQAKTDGKKTFEEIIIPTTEVVKIFGGNKWYYNRLKKTAKDLHRELVSVRDSENPEEGWLNLSIFSKMEFKSDKGLIIKFDDEMLPYLLELQNKRYTKIAGKTLFALNSVYATRLIELMLEYQNIELFRKTGRISRYISIDNLRQWLDVEDKYPKAGNFTKRVIEQPISEINTQTKYHMSYTVRKEGRKVIGYELKLLVSNDNSDTDTSIDDIIEQRAESKLKKAHAKNATIDNDEADIKSKLIHYGVGKIVAKRLADEYSEERILSNIKYSLNQKSVRNLGAYIPRAIREDYVSTKVVSHEAPVIMGSLFEDNATKDREYGKKLNEFFEGYGINSEMKVGSSLVAADNNHTRMSLTVRNALEGAGFSPELVMTAVRKRETPENPTTEAKTFAETIEQVAASKRDDYERESLKNEPSVLKEWERKLGAATYRAVVNAINSDNTESPILMSMLESKGFDSQLEIVLMLNEIAGELGIGEPEEDDNDDIIIDVSPNEPALISSQEEEPHVALSMDEKIAKLEKLAILKNAGVLTEEEFANMKQEVLNS